jgi:hypothetical protein
MSNTSSQTPTGMVSLVTLQKVDGNPAPQAIHVEGAAIHPNSSGQIQVDARLVPALLRAGWGFATSGGTVP